MNCLPLKPGSHMLPTYLGHRYGIREHLSLNHNLSQALDAGLPVKLSLVQLRKQAAVVGDETILREHHLRAQHTPVRRFNPYLHVKWLEVAQFNLHFA